MFYSISSNYLPSLHKLAYFQATIFKLVNQIKTSLTYVQAPYICVIYLTEKPKKLTSYRNIAIANNPGTSWLTMELEIHFLLCSQPVNTVPSCCRSVRKINCRRWIVDCNEIFQFVIRWIVIIGRNNTVCGLTTENSSLPGVGRT